MIYKFKSQADAGVIMLGLNGDQMLSIIGKESSAQGIVTVAKILAAIRALEAEIITHEAAESRAVEYLPAMELSAVGDSVRMRGREAPLIELLRNSAKAGKDMVWGV